MRKHVRKIMVPVLMLGCSAGFSADANNATEELFHLLDKGGCDPASLVARDWTISTNPENSHGELILGDVLRFEFIGPLNGVINPSAIQITRNGLIWQSASGWSGQCLSDGNITQYVIGGDVDIDGCLHDLAFGRLDHHDSLSNRIEVVFADSSVASEGSCDGDALLHPGHVHGGDG